MGEISAVLARLSGRRVYLDSNIFVYFLDRSPEHFPRVAPIFEAIERGAVVGLTGDVAVAEVMVKPYRSGDPALIADVKGFFGKASPIATLPHSAEDFDFAAQLRGKHGMKFIDALHLATALGAGCSAFITNDDGIGAPGGIEIVHLSGLTR